MKVLPSFWLCFSDVPARIVLQPETGVFGRGPVSGATKKRSVRKYFSAPEQRGNRQKDRFRNVNHPVIPGGCPTRQLHLLGSIARKVPIVIFIDKTLFLKGKN
jgi:hypothetical protein